MSMRRLSKLCLVVLLSLASAEQGNYDDAYAVDDNANDDGNDYYYASTNQDSTMFSAGDDYIKYWTDYALLPKRCIV